MNRFVAVLYKLDDGATKRFTEFLDIANKVLDARGARFISRKLDDSPTSQLSLAS